MSNGRVIGDNVFPIFGGAGESSNSSEEYDSRVRDSNSSEERDSRLRLALRAFREGFLSERLLDKFVKAQGYLPYPAGVEEAIAEWFLSRPKKYRK